MNKKIFIILSLISIFISPPARSAERITNYNWFNNPAIVKIREIYESTEKLIAQGGLSQSSKEFEYSEPYVDTERTIVLDSKGNVLKYINSGGSDDSALTRSFYYDLDGKLRFVFITGGAVNGSILEHRIYLDEKGERIWEDHKYTKGPGYSFPDPWPTEDIVFNPKKAYIQEGPTSFDNLSSVERAIKSGELGADMAERTKKTGNLYLQEVVNPGIPYKVFTFSDYQAGYTIMLEDNHLVLLCAGFGGGVARDFVFEEENEKDVLSYHFDVGSGVSHELTGHYVLGSGHATWGTLDMIKQ